MKMDIHFYLYFLFEFYISNTNNLTVAARNYEKKYKFPDFKKQNS